MNQLYGMLMLFIATLPFVLPVPARAAEPTLPSVTISEVNWSGSELSLADEWIELYNRTDSQVDLGGWLLSARADRGDLLELPTGTTILPNGALLIANYATDSGKTTLLFEPDVVSTALALPNSDLDLVLASPDGTVVDQVQFATPEFGSSKPKASMERDLETLSWKTATESLGLTTTDQFGTPGYIVPVTIDLAETSAPTDPPAFSRETCMAQFGLVAPEETAPVVPEPDVEDAVEDAAEITVAFISFTEGSLQISELVSDPEDGVEWIEMVNPGSATIDLTGWSVRDASEKVTALQGSIDPHGFTIIENPTGKLNNDGDTVNLLDPSFNVIDSVTYGTDIKAPGKGFSLSRGADGFQVTSILTKGAENQFDAPTEPTTYEETSLDPASESNAELDQSETVSNVSAGTNGNDPAVSQPATALHNALAVTHLDQSSGTADAPASSGNGTPASVDTIIGTVTALPGTFGDQIAFVDGIQIYFYHADWPELQLGDTVRVVGNFSKANGEKRIKVAFKEDIQVTGHVDLLPTDRTIQEAAQAKEGTLVRVIANVEQRDGDKLTVMDETGTLIVVAQKKTGVSWAGITSSRLAVTGIIRTINDEAHLYPRSSADVTNAPEETIIETAASPCTAALASVSKAPNAGPWIGGGLVTAFVLFAGYRFVKNRPDLKEKFTFQPAIS